MLGRWGQLLARSADFADDQPDVAQRTDVSDCSETTKLPVLDLPPILRAEYEAAPVPRGPWYRTIGPAYLGLFVWAPYFDSLWVGGLGRYSLSGLVASAFAASLLCFGLFYLIPAFWGFRTRESLGVVAASTFGTIGSEWLTGLGIAVAAVVWYAVAIDYAVVSTLLGLNACGLISAASLSPWELGPVVVKSPVYLTTAIFWIYITGTAGLWKLPGVVVALMRVYAPVAFVLLAGIAIWQIRKVGQYDIAISQIWNLGPYDVETARSMTNRPGLTSLWRAHTSAVPLIVGFFAMSGLAGVDWGRRAARRRDVVLGGVVGVVLAGSLTAIMSLIIVTSTLREVSRESSQHVIDYGGGEGLAGRGSPTLLKIQHTVLYYGSGEWFAANISDPMGLTFRWAVYHGIGGIPAGVILVLFGLAALAPACYAASIYGERLATRWPRLGQSGWTWVGGAIALVLGATSLAGELELIFAAMGTLFAPAVGAMTGDWLRQRGAWAGVRPGVNRTGLLAWVAGVAIAWTLELAQVMFYRGDALRFINESAWWHSTAIAGFVASMVYYWLLAALGREGAAVPIGRHDEH
jgi:cytosine permease